MAEKDSTTNSTSNTGLTAEQLETLLARVIKAVKEPTALEQKKINAEEKAIADANASRLRISGEVKGAMEGKKFTQRTCSHEHPDGHTHCVYIQEKVGPGYLLCQKNQCVIRPGVASPNYQGSVIYSNELFNKIFQKLQSGAGDIIG
jgi:hypothetical protein